MLSTTVHSSPGSCALVLSDLQSEQLKVSTHILWIIDQIFPRKNRNNDNQSGSVVSLTTAHRLPKSTFCCILLMSHSFGFADLGKTCL